MKLTTRRRSRPAAASESVSAGQFTWSHQGTAWRVTAWPDAAFERSDRDGWRAAEPDDAVFATAAVVLTAVAWRGYLEFVPLEERQFLAQFGFGRLEALWVLSRSPEMLAELAETPALTAFVAAHATLRGTEGPRWAELRAVRENGGMFAVLEWLGLPAARETLAALRNVVDPDVPRYLLRPLRRSLWNPAAASALRRKPLASDRELAQFCHALAA
jgi:hypothetical protein